MLIELDRMGLITWVGDYQGYPIHDGRVLALFNDRHALHQAITNGLAAAPYGAHSRPCHSPRPAPTG